MVRFVSREEAIRGVVPDAATILEDVVVYSLGDELVIVPVFLITNDCEDCADLWGIGTIKVLSV